MGNSQYSTNTKIGQVDLTTEQIESIYDLSIKITTLIPELILYLVKENKGDTMQNYTGFDFTIKYLSHSFTLSYPSIIPSIKSCSGVSFFTSG